MMLWFQVAGGLLSIEPVGIYRVWSVIRLTQNRDNVDSTVKEVFGAIDNIEAMDYIKKDSLQRNVLMARKSDLKACQWMKLNGMCAMQFRWIGLPYGVGFISRQQNMNKVTCCQFYYTPKCTNLFTSIVPTSGGRTHKDLGE